MAIPGVIRIFLATPVDSGVIATVTQDDRPVTGSIVVNENGTVVEFTPYTPLVADAAIKVAMSANRDLSGRPLAAYAGVFATVASATPVPEVTRITPGLREGTPRNPVIEVEYSRPLDTASIISGSIQLTESAVKDGTSVIVAVRSDNIIRVMPNTLMKPYAVYELRISGSVADLLGNPALPAVEWVMPGITEVSGPPALVKTVPAGHGPEIDAFGVIHLIFDRSLNPLTVSAETVKVTQGGALAAVSVEYGKDGAEVILTPVAPWNAPGTVQVTVTGVEDLAGNAVENWSAVFTVRMLQSQRGPGLPR